MECDICLIYWDSTEHIPRLLSCGHSFCQICLMNILKKSIQNKTLFRCPTCNSVQKNIKTEKDIQNLIKNYNLLEISDKIEERRSTTRESNSKKLNTNSIMNILQLDNEINQRTPSSKNITKYEYEENNNKNGKYIFDINRRCEKHNLPIHSYTIDKNFLLCDSCIKEMNNIEYKPLPNTIKELLKIIDSTLFKACVTKNQISLLQRFFESYLIEFEKVNLKKIDELFDKYEKIIKYFKNNTKQILEQCMSEQKNNIKGYFIELEKLSKELTKIEEDLIYIANIKDTNIFLKKIDNIKFYERRLVNFINYDLEFNLLSLNINFKEKEKDNLFKAIQNSMCTEIEFFEIKKKLPTIGQVLRIEETWPCICDEVNNPINEVKCSSCGLYRRLETFSNKINKIDINNDINENINLNEIINNKENNEKNIIEKNESLINLIKTESIKEYKSIIQDNNSNAFYAIDLIWFDEWKNYMQKSGLFPPGPINNKNLLKVNLINGSYEILKKLVRNKDYIIVNQELWEFLHFNCNGGPIIEVLNNNELKLENNIKYISDYCIQSYTKLKDEYLNEDE